MYKQINRQMVNVRSIFSKFLLPVQSHIYVILCQLCFIFRNTKQEHLTQFTSKIRHFDFFMLLQRFRTSPYSDSNLSLRPAQTSLVLCAVPNLIQNRFERWSSSKFIRSIPHIKPENNRTPFKSLHSQGPSAKDIRQAVVFRLVKSNI